MLDESNLLYEKQERATHYIYTYDIIERRKISAVGWEINSRREKVAANSCRYIELLLLLLR